MAKVMSDKEYRLLLVMAASPYSLTAYEAKRAGGFWFLPWQHVADMFNKGWLTREPSAIPGPGESRVPRYYKLSERGREVLEAEVARRVKARESSHNLR